MQAKPLRDPTERMNALLAPNLAVDWPNLPIDRAEGVYVWGKDGRRYFDFVSGMASANLGHRHPRVIEAAKAQMDKLIHGPIGVLLYDPVLEAAESLRDVMPGDIDMFFFGNSGAEAIEGALKLARYVSGRPAIVAFRGGFHGRTMGAASVTTSKSKYRAHYEPLLSSVYFAPYPYCYRCPFGRSGGACSLECLEDMKAMFRHEVHPSEVAAVLMEPVLGEGGYVVPPREYLTGLRSLCDEHGILLVLDEVQTGFGRTGAMFACQALSAQPDIMAIAKSIASGFPLGVTAAPARLMRQWAPGTHGTTFGGNPVSCAAAVATIDVMTSEDIPGRAARLGEHALKRLGALAGEIREIGDVRGLGLMIGIEFVRPGTKEPNGGLVERVLQEALDRGLILYPCGAESHCIRFIPPLVISEEDLDAGLDIFAAAVSAAAAG
jgi:4-aminobutyrate aminotransferase